MSAKINIATAALDLLGVTGSLIQENAQDSSRALRYLERLAQEWKNVGLLSTYNDADDFLNPNPQQDSGATPAEENALVNNLAVRIGGHYGIVSPLINKAAKESYEAIISFDLVPYQQNPNMPAGQGNQRCYGDFPYMPVESE